VTDLSVRATESTPAAGCACSSRRSSSPPSAAARPARLGLLLRRPVGGAAASRPHHDPAAPPIEVRVTAGVVDRLLADVADHLRGPHAHDETGWVPIGRVAAGVVSVEGLLSAGRRPFASPAAFEPDHAHVLAALVLLQAREPADVVGLIHTHPGSMDWNSAVDQVADEGHVLALPGGIGVYPIVVRERRASGPVVRAGVRVAWWGLRASRPAVYAPCRVEVVPGEDAGAWLGPHDDALAEAGEVVLELLERGVAVTLLPAPAGAVDLMASSAGGEVLVRFDPLPGHALLTGPAGPRRRRLAANGRDLGRLLADLTTTSPAADAPGPRAGSPNNPGGGAEP
jgi:hypothetical protein